MSPEAMDHEAMRIDRLEPERRREVISAYLDSELSPVAARHMTTWLDAHPDVLRDVEHLRRVWDLLDLYADEPVPEGFAARVFERVGSAAARPRRPRLLSLRRAMLAAAAVLLVAFGVWFFAERPGDGEERSPGPDVAVLEDVPVEYLEEADFLLALSDDMFQAYLLTDLEEPWEDG